MAQKKSSNQKYRSKFEARLAVHLKHLGFEYEPFNINYTVPESKHKYKPDFVRGRLIYELKGKWTSQDRKKMKLLVEQHPEFTFVMVFQNPNVKIAKNSKTTYATWCEKNNIEWIPYTEAG